MAALRYVIRSSQLNDMVIFDTRHGISTESEENNSGEHILLTVVLLCTPFPKLTEEHSTEMKFSF